jgi:hypothetical protein
MSLFDFAVKRMTGVIPHGALSPLWRSPTVLALLNGWEAWLKWSSAKTPVPSFPLEEEEEEEEEEKEENFLLLMCNI